MMIVFWKTEVRTRHAIANAKPAIKMVVNLEMPYAVWVVIPGPIINAFDRCTTIVMAEKMSSPIQHHFTISGFFVTSNVTAANVA